MLDNPLYTRPPTSAKIAGVVGNPKLIKARAGAQRISTYARTTREYECRVLLAILIALVLICLVAGVIGNAFTH